MSIHELLYYFLLCVLLRDNPVRLLCYIYQQASFFALFLIIITILFAIIIVTIISYFFGISRT